jgi:uncharacterized protein involved in outer membrane biogenesis
MSKLWPRSSLGRTGVIVLTLLVALVIFLGVYDWHSFNKPLARLAGGYLHREVTIDRLEAQLLRWHPIVTVDGLRIANPEWAGEGDTVNIQSITAAIVPWRLLTGHLVLAELRIDRPHVNLLRDNNNRATWDFDIDQDKPKPKKPNDRPAQLPVVYVFTMQGGALKVDDKIRKLTFEGNVNAHEGGAPGEGQPFQLMGHGELNEKKFQLIFSGSPLMNLQLDQPYHYDTSIEA